ncbi:hypothetical protein BC952_0057 [Flavobacterium limicola]|uniref:Uncharacterized protein n=1 Tax=Flavobacterium limicola TaxID=180441 RepID=A0A495S554_9FLAO|nr:hypothetical protein BC952_0057 [Flavobacterium limicola]
MALAAIILLTVELFVNWNFRLFIYIFYFYTIISVAFKKKLPVIWEAFAI